MQYKSTAELRGLAKQHMFGNYSVGIGAYVLVNLILVSLTLMISSVLPEGNAGRIIYYIFCGVLSVVSGVFNSGAAYLFLNIVCGKLVYTNMIMHGFKSGTDKAIKLQVMILVLNIIVSIPVGVTSAMFMMSERGGSIILVVVSAIIAVVGICVIQLEFMPALYILHDFPEYDFKQILELSMRLMEGNKLRLFILYLSFIPMQLLALLSLGIGSLWVEPFKSATMAEFFMDLMNPKGVERI